MTTITRTLVILLTAACLAFPSYAAAPNKEALTKELMKLSGLEQQIHQIPQQVLAGFDKDGKKLPPQRYAALRRVLSQAYNAQTLERNVYKRMHSELTHELATNTLSWLRTDLGRKITKFEEQASMPQAIQQMGVFAKKLESSPPSQQRLGLARRIDLSTDATEILLDIAESSTFGLALALDATLPPNQRQGEARLRVQMERQRPKLREAYQQLSMVNALFTYQSLSDAELERYVDFLESELGTQYTTLANAALKDALYEASTHVNRGMAMLLSQWKNRKSEL
ncbi:MAG TPA: hypothetical protein VFL31_06885 [Nitrospiraceae bacterium]|nr:hypothetical protein [Nitrospiraceae bacterium]